MKDKTFGYSLPNYPLEEFLKNKDIQNNINYMYNLSETDKKNRAEINTFIEKNHLDSAISRINYIENIIEKKKSIDKIFIKALDNKDEGAAKKVIKYYDSEYDQEEAMKKLLNLEQK